MMVSYLLGLLLGAQPLGAAETPVARVEAVTDTYHGESVKDPYRWLEDGSDAEVQGWSEAQNAYARAYLDSLPSREAIHARIAEIRGAASASYSEPTWAGGRLFAMKRQPPSQQRFLVMMTSPDDAASERVVVDPNALDRTGGTSIDWYRPSPDGSLVAVSLSRGGSENGDAHVFRTATGEELDGDLVPRVNGGTAGGDLAWLADGSGFLYSRYPREGERPAADMAFYTQIYFHRLGNPPELDEYELGESFDRIAEIHMQTDPSSGRVLATVQYGDSGRFAFYLRRAAGGWKQIAAYEDGIVQGTFAPDGTLYFISQKNAPRGFVLRMTPDLPRPDLGRVIVPEGTDTIVADFWAPPTMTAGGKRLYVTYQTGGPSELRVFDRETGAVLPAPEQLPVSTTGSPLRLEGDTVLFSSASYLEPQAWYRYDPATGTTERTALASTSPVDFSDTEVVRESAVSKDGTRIPVNILRRKGLVLDGNHPVLLTGYGGFAVSLSPYLSAVRRVWIEQGGVYAIANIRGGGEFGEAWHRAGMLTQKQNVFDDFAAAMEHMIEAGYTTPERLAITGGSNGGLLMGAMITQHPDRFRAVVSHVGIYDMLRVERSPNGAFNIPEYGSVADPDQFQAMRAYSPYHNVRDGIAYPAVLFMTGANDPRVDPMQSRKMTARLQAANQGGGPILLRTSRNTGHGGGTALTERINQDTDQYAFLFHTLRLPYHRVSSPQE